MRLWTIAWRLVALAGLLLAMLKGDTIGMHIWGATVAMMGVICDAADR